MYCWRTLAAFLDGRCGSDVIYFTLSTNKHLIGHLTEETIHDGISSKILGLRRKKLKYLVLCWLNYNQYHFIKISNFARNSYITIKKDFISESNLVTHYFYKSHTHHKHVLSPSENVAECITSKTSWTISKDSSTLCAFWSTTS